MASTAAHPSPQAAWHRTGKRIVLNVMLLVLFIGGWHLYTVLANVPEYLLPSPFAVWDRLLWLIARGELQRHTWVTFQEIFAGVAIGAAVGVVFGYVLGKSRTVERILSPYILVAQTAPKVSLAPLFIVWFGLELTSKVVLVALVVFFPIMVNGMVGIRSVDKRLHELMSLLGATQAQVFWSIEAPSTLAHFLSGLRIASTQSVVAAIIGELMGARAGLGYLLTLGHETYDITLVLAALFTVSLAGLVLYLVVQQIEQRALRWAEDHSA